jgi:hypothetical protein
MRNKWYGILITLAAVSAACNGADTSDDNRDSDSSIPGADAGADSGSSDDAGADDGGDAAVETDSEPLPDLEIVGTYVSDWGAEMTITNTEWLDVSASGTSRFAIELYNNDADFLAAQNSAENDYFPSKWSRFEWTFDADVLYYCQILYEEGDLEAVSGAENLADSADLDAGCGGFSWSKLASEEASEADAGAGDGGEDGA